MINTFPHEAEEYDYRSEAKGSSPSSGRHIVLQLRSYFEDEDAVVRGEDALLDCCRQGRLPYLYICVVAFRVVLFQRAEVCI